MTTATPDNGKTPLKAKDFATDQEVRWCPACGDYSVLKQVQTAFAEMGLDKDKIAIISGIGCSSRFPYYVDTYGMHSIHGRAPGIASGLKIAKPGLSVWIATGDGDALSIGGNHILHLLRRNFDINVLLFNNQIYGMTKGQYSPTSEENKRTTSTPMGSIDHPINPLVLAMGMEGTFIARAMDRDAKHLLEMIKRCYHHRGTAFLEIYQNCNIFNDGTFDIFTDKETRADTALYLEHGQPLRFGARQEKGIRLDGFKPVVVDLEEGKYRVDDLWIHDERDLCKAQMLTRFNIMPNAQFLPRPFGVFYATQRPCYEDMLHEQIALAREQQGPADLDALLSGNTTWEV